MESAKADMSAAQDTVCRKQALYHELGVSLLPVISLIFHMLKLFLSHLQSVVGQSTDPVRVILAYCRVD